MPATSSRRSLALPAPTLAPEARGPARSAPAGADPFGDPIATAIREGAVRASVAGGLAALVVIHAVDAVGKWSETRLVVEASVVAVALGGLATGRRAAAALA